MSFVHLHQHSVYSTLDGLSKLGEIVKSAKDFEQSATALTDHGNIAGLYKFYNECKKEEIKPILGSEIYFDWSIESTRFPAHLTILCKNNDGWKNLLYLIRFANTVGFRYKPRVVWEELKRHNDGLIVLSGCMSSIFTKLILEGESIELEQRLREFQSVFGDRFFLEIMKHNLDEQDAINNTLEDMSKRLGIPMVATNDNHYIKQEDAFAQEVLMCDGMKKTLADSDRPRLSAEEFYFKSEEQMLQLHRAEHVNITQEIADSIDVTIEKQTLVLPNYPEDELDKRIAKRCSGLKMNKEVKARIKSELRVIKKAKLEDYLLTVADYVDYGKNQGYYIGPGRGSVAGSLICYLLGIHNIRPIHYKLFFGRFYNEGRSGSLPDIDIDFSVRDIQNMRNHMEEEYGADKVALIGTNNAMFGKSALKAVCRVFNIKFDEANSYTKMMPQSPTQNTIEHAMDIPDFKSKYDKDTNFKNLVDLASKLEGSISSGSIHAAGLVVSRVPLSEIVPTRMDTTTGMMITNWDMHDLEDIGLLKFDFLSLATLDVIQGTIEQIPHIRTYEKLPTKNRAAFKMISDGNTVGIFQLSSDGITRLAKQIKPKDIDDISTIVALYRPGPIEAGLHNKYVKRRQKREGISYKHPKLKNALEDTYGCIIFQEQVIQILIDLAGFNEHEADHVRKVIGKKLGKEEMAKIGRNFVRRCVNRSVPEKVSESIWNDIQGFCGYAFNKAHSVSYAHLTYYTAYLKANYPLEFMVSLLNSSFLKTNSREFISEYLRECYRMGIEILPPSITKSKDIFTKEGNKIRAGLACIKGVGFGAEDKICREGLSEFITKSSFNITAIKGIIQCGGCDEFETNRNKVLAYCDILKSSKKINEELSLFSPYKLIDMPEAEKETQRQQIQWEFDLIGEPVSHDIFSMDWFKQNQLKHERIVLMIRRDSKVKVGGMVTDVYNTFTKKDKRPMAIITLYTPIGYYKVLVTADTYLQFKDSLYDGNFVAIIGKGKVEDDDAVVLFADYVVEI